MSIGMAVNSGHLEAKKELADLLLEAAKGASSLDLWVNGAPFSQMLAEVATTLLK